MMTREDAIEYFKMKVSAREAIGNDIGTDYEAYKIALSALRPVSREQVEKVWRGEWEHPGYYNDGGSFVHDCSKCNTPSTDEYWFCPFCGAPMTDKAVQIVMERLEEIKNG